MYVSEFLRQRAEEHALRHGSVIPELVFGTLFGCLIVAVTAIAQHVL